MSLSTSTRARIESRALTETERDEARALIAQFDRPAEAGTPREGLVEIAVSSLLDYRRTQRLLATLRAETVRSADRRFLEAQQDRVLRCLVLLNESQCHAMIEFKRFAAGIRHILSRWERLEQAFLQDQTWYGNMVLEAIQMQGVSARMDELYFSEEAWLTWAYCHVAQANPDLREGELLWSPEVMPISIQENPPQPWPLTREYCQEQLRKLLASEIPPLRALEQKLRLEVEEPARAAAAELALAAISVQESRLVQQLQGDERSYQRAVAALEQARRRAESGLALSPDAAVAMRISPALLTKYIPEPAPAPEPEPTPPEPDPEPVPVPEFVPAPSGPDPGPEKAANQARTAAPAPRDRSRTPRRVTSTTYGCGGGKSGAASGARLPWPQRHACKTIPGNPAPPICDAEDTRNPRQTAAASAPSETQQKGDFQMFEPCEVPSDPNEWKVESSPARVAASRANGALSHGPGAEGKLVSRYNAGKHFMTSKLPVIPGESAEELEGRLVRWRAQLGATTEPQQFLADLATHAGWIIERIRRSAAAASTKAVTALVEGAVERDAAAVRVLAPRLAEGPEVVAELRASPAGVRLLLERLDSLEKHLAVETNTSLDLSQKRLLIHLHQCRCDELLTCQVTKAINIAYLSGLHGRGALSAAGMAELLSPDRPAHVTPGELERAMEGWLPELKSVAEGHAALKELVAKLRAVLTERLELVSFRFERDLALEAEKVKTTSEVPNRHRYETAQVNILKGSLAALRAMQKHGQGQGQAEPGGDCESGDEQQGTKDEGQKEPEDGLRNNPRTGEPVEPAFPDPTHHEGMVDEASDGVPAVARGPSA